MMAQWTGDLDETGLVRLAELMALKLCRGDLIGLGGEVGAGVLPLQTRLPPIALPWMTKHED